MFRELRFDVVGPVNRRSKYDAEWEAVHQFLSSDHKNMVLDYDNSRDANNARLYFIRLVKAEKLPVVVGVFRSKSVVVKKK